MPTTLLLGASRGIGLELARQAVAAGERVIATARSDDGLATLRELGCQVLKLDVANPASVSGLAWQLDGEKIDTAWHVAGVMCSRADATQPPTQQDFDRVMHANVLGAMQVIPQVAPLVEAAQGRFAFLSSVMGQIGSAADLKGSVDQNSQIMVQTGLTVNELIGAVTTTTTAANQANIDRMTLTSQATRALEYRPQ